jgi:hypothetical protein
MSEISATLSSSLINLGVYSLKYTYRNVVSRLNLVGKVPNLRIQKYNTEILTSEDLKKLLSCGRDIRLKLIMRALFNTRMRFRVSLHVRIKTLTYNIRAFRPAIVKGHVVYCSNRLHMVQPQYCKCLGYLPKDYLIESYKDSSKALNLEVRRERFRTREPGLTKRSRLLR